MSKQTITPELWADLKEIQSSMAIEGFDLTDKQLEEIGQSCLKSDIPQKLNELKAQADKEGRDYADVVNEGLGLGLDLSGEE